MMLALSLQLQERQCVGNLGTCDKGQKNCCDGLYCCGFVIDHNVCQSGNTCGE